jgi:LysM repeat protein
MKNYIVFIIQLTLIAFLFSCSSYKPVASKSDSGLSAEDYINKYKDLAVKEMKRTGIPASITLAQGMIESDFGRSRLAREGNNHFGIKCHDDWNGATIRHNDDKRNECFRKYKRPEESFYDHSDFIKSVPRYSFLFAIEPTDYKGWARGLKKAGYATNPDYANMLIKSIEENNLSIYDHGNVSAKSSAQKAVPAKDSVPDQLNDSRKSPATIVKESTAVPERVSRIKENNRIKYIIVKEGETRAKLENEFQLLKWELAKFNELSSDFQPVPGQILYLQPKREKGEPGKEYYIAAEGDTMYLISQRFGIKLKSLYELNRMAEKSEPETGKKIWLRSIKPVN